MYYFFRRRYAFFFKEGWLKYFKFNNNHDNCLLMPAL